MVVLGDTVSVRDGSSKAALGRKTGLLMVFFSFPQLPDVHDRSAVLAQGYGVRMLIDDIDRLRLIRFDVYVMRPGFLRLIGQLDHSALGILRVGCKNSIPLFRNFGRIRLDLRCSQLAEHALDLIVRSCPDIVVQHIEWIRTDQVPGPDALREHVPYRKRLTILIHRIVSGAHTFLEARIIQRLARADHVFQIQDRVRHRIGEHVIIAVLARFPFQTDLFHKLGRMGIQ